MERADMAGDWLKVEKDTPEKPEVFIIAATLDIHPDEAFGKCFKFWRWADSHLVDGNAASVTKNVVDALVGRVGFSDALVKVGWLQEGSGSLVIPNFGRHMSKSAKARALTASRVSRHKRRRESENGNEKVTRSALVPLLFSSISPELDSSFRNSVFQDCWDRWVKHRSEIKKPLKPTQAKAQLAMLQKLGLDAAVAMVNHTITSGWTGLRAPDERKANGRTSKHGPGQVFDPDAAKQPNVGTL